MKCVIQIITIDESIKCSSIRHQEVCVNDIIHDKILHQPKEADVWIVLAKLNKESVHHQLVNMRWKSNLDRDKWTNDNVVEGLFKSIVSELRTDGLDAKRSGGSNGTPTYSNTNILKLLKTSDAFVRKGKGIKLIKSKNKWKCYYLKSGKGKEKDGNSKVSSERNFTRYGYSQPQTSGNFEMNYTLMSKYFDVITSMTEAKYNSPHLIMSINNLLSIEIQTGAVDAALNDYENAKELTFFILDKTERDKSLIRQLAMDNLYTLVAYPCSYHFDVFKEGQYSLENKICFSFKSSEIDPLFTGRGGGDKEEVCYAVLDWSNSSQGRRRRQFIASGAVLKTNEPVTQSKWNARFQNNNS